MAAMAAFPIACISLPESMGRMMAFSAAFRYPNPARFRCSAPVLPRWRSCGGEKELKQVPDFDKAPRRVRYAADTNRSMVCKSRFVSVGLASNATAPMRLKKRVAVRCSCISSGVHALTPPQLPPSNGITLYEIWWIPSPPAEPEASPPGRDPRGGNRTRLRRPPVRARADP